MYSSLHLLIKLILFFILLILLRKDFINKSPDNGVEEIQFIGKSWVLTLNDGKRQNYPEAHILIHNTLFQLLQFANGKQKKLIVLFQDQLSSHQWRLFYLKIAQK